MTEREVLKAEDLDMTGNLFGFRFVPRDEIDIHGTSRKTNPLVEMYVEDDENWHYVTSFDSAWLPDMRNLSGRAILELVDNPRNQKEVINTQMEAGVASTY